MDFIEKLYVNINNLDPDVSTVNEIYLKTIPMTPLVEQGQIRLVLSWPDSPADLDIHSIFLVSARNKCEVFFGKKECLGVDLDVDNLKGGKNGVETITIRELGKYIYTFTVHRYVDISNGVSAGENPISDSPIENTDPYAVPLAATPLPESKATVSVYASGYRGPLLTINVPNEIKENDLASDYNWWNVLCLDGNKGLSSFSVVNEISTSKPISTYCANHYKSLPSTNMIEISSKMKRN
jgi:hypothetical protein